MSTYFAKNNIRVNSLSPAGIYNKDLPDDFVELHDLNVSRFLDVWMKFLFFSNFGFCFLMQYVFLDFCFFATKMFFFEFWNFWTFFFPSILLICLYQIFIFGFFMDQILIFGFFLMKKIQRSKSKFFTEFFKKTFL